MKRVFKNAFCGVFLGAFLSACATYPHIELKPFESKSFTIKNANNTYILHISHIEESYYHFALLDTIGSPVASKIYKDSAFRDIKLLPPNDEINDIFIKCLQMIKDDEKHSVFLGYDIAILEQ